MYDFERRPGDLPPAQDVFGMGGGVPGKSTLVDTLDFDQDHDEDLQPANQNQAAHGPTVPAGLPGPAAPAAPAAPATPATGPLTPAQVADAMSFHTLQPQKYTKPVITEIQGAVGAPATGVMDPATVQGIAKRQAAINADRKPIPPLVVDGKAGPRTLPILAPVGLATDANIKTYVDDIKGMKKGLDAATDPAARAALIMKELNARLAAVGVPPITKPVVLDGSLNQFTSGNWTMTMSTTALADPDFAASTMYHEARHAEQAFRVARMLAGKKRSADQIAAETPIEAAQVAAAQAAPLEPGTTEALEAEGWHEDEIGRPTQAQQKAKSDAAIDKFVDAARAFKADPTPANHERASAAYDEWKAAYVSSYRDKPDEYDAFFVGDKVSDGLGTSRRDDFVSLDNAISQIPPK